MPLARGFEYFLAILGGCYAEEPQNLLFFVAAVAAGVDADGGKLAALAPAFNGKRGHA